MPWRCTRGCHAASDAFLVKSGESRMDYIVHYYAADDAELDNDVCHPKVYEGPDSEWDEPVCAICESEVRWIDD